MLTSKAKIEFEKWFNNEYPELACDYNGNFNMPDTLYNALIIEWFDSIGITVDVMPILNNPLKFMPNTFWLEKEYSMSEEEPEYFDNRQEATQKAIEKACEIYNN